MSALPASARTQAWNRRLRVAFTLALAGLALPSFAPAQQTPGAQTAPKEGAWIADARGCKVFNPTPKPKEAVKWSGPCVNGMAEGKGVLEFSVDGKPGARYEGTLKRGKLDGRGVLRDQDGSVYDGDWADGKQDGFGKYQSKDGTAYEGGWTAGQPDGPGTYRSATGEVVRGLWKAGQLVQRYRD
jgi:hypothetical protein